jgi:tetratricopeptide (TPR) repeat protein/DNA-binding XRE family transcriptional regulator
VLEGDDAKMSWWVELGYPPFEEGKGGFPRAGQVVKYYRERKRDDKGRPWTQKGLAKVLGISENAVRDIENRDAGMEFERRQFLCKLFDIPPILLGIITIEQIEEILRERGNSLSSFVMPEKLAHVTISSSTATTPRLTLDVAAYREKLISYWKTDYSQSAHEVVGDIMCRISALYQELPYARSKDYRCQLQGLLCDYHQFTGHLLRDRQRYDDAITHLNKAFQLVKSLGNPEQKALVLFSRGYILWNANRIKEAIVDFENAGQYRQQLPYYLNGSILLFSGLTQALSAKTEKEQKEAQSLIDQGGNIARTHRKEKSPYFIDFNLNRYHGVKSLALIAAGQNRDAIDELKLRTSYANVHGQVYYDISLAQMHVNLGDYAQAAYIAIYALEIAREINSDINITRIANIHQQLQKSSYKNNPDVARLEYLLGKK